MASIALGLLLALQSSPAPQAAAADILGTLAGTEEHARGVGYVVSLD